jgi:hypothetical protein
VLFDAEPDMGAQASVSVSFPSSRDWDLMMFEVVLVSSGAGLFSRPMGSPVGDGPGVDSPILEPVFFSDASA